MSEVTSAQWDKVRERFQESLMIDTHLHNLAANVGTSWFFRDKEETPRKYLDKSFAELSAMEEFLGQPQRIERLVSILEDTIAFDDPWEDMIDEDAPGIVKGEDALRTLEKHGIPKTFPIALTGLTGETKKMCDSEEIADLEQFITFFQNMASNIVIGGDIRAFLNTLNNPDEKALAEILPYRPGATGVHLVEAIGMSLNSLDADRRWALLSHLGATPVNKDNVPKKPISGDQKEATYNEIAGDLDFLMDFFADTRDELKEAKGDDKAFERLFRSLNDADLETLAIEMVRAWFGGGPGKAKEKGGFLKSIAFWKK